MQHQLNEIPSDLPEDEWNFEESEEFKQEESMIELDEYGFPIESAN